ncbi:unnamed protein product [Sphenostylis stenocarpa]|uniref:GBF-interacting protein 1 N-terminal domain-containing protein n=1 Tax=Sphenostylis stenocarpa TaxID=92480 RepID=A0AA86TFJ5_9FABA|nr:unnamed protein product [Sphenostylis stenocarpa]
MNGDGYGAGEHVAAESGVSAAAEKVMQSVKEIVDCPDHEIYAVLEECDMDVNRAVEKLLSQGFALLILCASALAFVVAVEHHTFHEVKSKRERKKEGAFNSKTRGKNVGLSRRGKTGSGSDCSVVQSGLTHVTYNEEKTMADAKLGEEDTLAERCGVEERREVWSWRKKTTHTRRMNRE